MQQTGDRSIRVYRADGLFLAYVFATFGSGTLFEGHTSHDLFFPLTGWAAVGSSVALLLFSLTLPKRLSPGPSVVASALGRFFWLAFYMLFAGNIFLGIGHGYAAPWATVIGLVLCAPFVSACLALVVWVIPSHARQISAVRHDV
jgi:hypothetical protein